MVSNGPDEAAKRTGVDQVRQVAFGEVLCGRVDAQFHAVRASGPERSVAQSLLLLPGAARVRLRCRRRRRSRASAVRADDLRERLRLEHLLSRQVILERHVGRPTVRPVDVAPTLKRTPTS